MHMWVNRMRYLWIFRFFIFPMHMGVNRRTVKLASQVIIACSVLICRYYPEPPGSLLPATHKITKLSKSM